MEDEILSSLGVQGMTAAVNALSTPAEKLGNTEDIEFQWAVKAYHHAETYFNILTSVDNQLLKLTSQDDEIHKQFREFFSDLKIDIINIEDLKSEAAKLKWRPFCNAFEDLVEDFNFGTLLRLDCKEGYSEENSTFVTRIQFFAIEIARNREGLNRVLWKRGEGKTIEGNSEHNDES